MAWAAPLEEREIGCSNHVHWVGYSHGAVGVRMGRNLYEFATDWRMWSDLVATVERARAWWNSSARKGPGSGKKPPGVSVGTFIAERMKDTLPQWKVNRTTGACSPLNAQARGWESKNGKRGHTRVFRSPPPA